MVVIAAFRADAQTVSIYPTEVLLDHAADFQRIVAVAAREDGFTLDVTAQATVTFQPEGIAKLDESFRLVPVADGEATAIVTVGDKTATLPVHVKNAAATPPVSFRNDVQPALMRAGCNTGACHGSAQGKNGFRLSLFGFDPAADYLHLSRDVRGRRLAAASPDESLMLLKPTGAVPHEGGTRFDKDSELYATIRAWIAADAPDDPADLKTLTGVEVLPKEAVLEGEGTAQALTVIAKYSDGSDRDVTRLAILSTSDDQTVKIDENGVMTAGGRGGEAYVMARFGTFAVVSQAIVLPAGSQLQWPEVPVNNYIDEAIYAKLKKLRVPPAEIAPDDAFVRRVYLDVIGVLPTVEETQAFLADPAPDKRVKLVDQLLQRPEFPEVWAMKWAEVLRVQPSPVLDVKAMHRYNDWLRQSISEGKPVDRMASELLTAQGGNFASPAANFYIAEADPAMMAENVAQVFLGIQIKCAQCHNHPFERWTMDDYYSFSAFFGQVGRKASTDPRETIIFDRQSGEVKNLRDGRPMPPKFLGGAVPDVAGKDRRAVLAEWLTAPENPWFAKNMANRVWHHFFGKGIVDPVDDVRVSNPPSNPQLLDALAGKLVSYKYDLRQLVRDICTSYTYQMTTRPRDPNIMDGRNFSHALVRRMSAEQLLDSISLVTESKVKFPNLPVGARAAEVAGGDSGNYFLKLFGRPVRETVCTCER
ncbi:MAG: DUF1549 and DUF1553 domain-containing protein, partial [FCB group bacterium]|nr:DUF1549 and DUF1553 domain-containing protein [FCB group bacterium]